MLVIQNSDSTRFPKLKVELQKNYLCNMNQHSEITSKALNILSNYIAPKSRTKPILNRSNNSQSSKVAFLQGSSNDNAVPAPRKDRELYSSVKCHKCYKFGHYRNEYPLGDDDQDLSRTSML